MKKNIKIISIMLFLLSVATVSAVTMGFTIGPGFAQPLYTDTNDNVKLLESSEEKLESNIEPKMVFDIEEVRCLAENIYHEARNQGTAGWLAVASVTLNRVTDDRFPDTICGVVFQAETKESWKTKSKKDIPDAERIFYPVRHRCQFSWYCDGKSDDINHISIFLEIMTFTKFILTSQIMMFDITDGATFYHADYVTPSWAKSKTKTIEIGDHIFYRWKK
jgi:spore germination cell wall hydrolase CwlJ-like protein